jgi:hypothetical protein
VRGNRRPVAIAMIAAVALFILAACGGEPTRRAGIRTLPPPTSLNPSPTTPSPTVDATEIEVQVEGGEVTGPGEVSVKAGEFIIVIVRADIADEVHIHGYDLLEQVAPGEPAGIPFTADITGVFEVELEGAGLLLFRLTVNP